MRAVPSLWANPDDPSNVASQNRYLAPILFAYDLTCKLAAILGTAMSVWFHSLALKISFFPYQASSYVIINPFYQHSYWQLACSCKMDLHVDGIVSPFLTFVITSCKRAFLPSAILGIVALSAVQCMASGCSHLKRSIWPDCRLLATVVLIMRTYALYQSKPLLVSLGLLCIVRYGDNCMANRF